MTFLPRMKVFILLSLACISIAMAPSAAHAQEYPPPPPSYPPPPPYPPPSSPPSYASRYETRFTITPFIGVRFGGRVNVNTPNVDYLPISSSLNGGFDIGVAIVPHLFGEFMWNRQSTTLSAHDKLTDSTLTLTNGAHLDMYQLSLLYEISTRSPLRPFVVAGFGVTHFDSNGVLNFHNRFSYNIGGGVKYLFAPQVALRAELRWSPSRTTSSNTIFCDPSLGCFNTPVHNYAEQGQANIGLEFRF